MLKINLLFVVTALALSNLACSDIEESSLPLHAPGLSTPVVTGLHVTDDAGRLLGTWGTPSDPDDEESRNPFGGAQVDTSEPIGIVPRYYSFSLPYPNPSDGTNSFEFSLPRRSTVDLWVVRARWGDSGNADIVSIGGSTVSAPKTQAMRTLMRGRTLESGYYNVIWEGKDDSGGPAAAGFYRVYIRANEFFSWRDMFLFRSWDDVPASLRAMLHH